MYEQGYTDGCLQWQGIGLSGMDSPSGPNDHQSTCKHVFLLKALVAFCGSYLPIHAASELE